LCEIFLVSKSGYYSWLSRIDNRAKQDEKDKQDFEIILKAYKAHNRHKGIRLIYSYLLQNGIRMNKKKIHRLMRKFGLFCPLRKANPYRRMQVAMKTNNYASNLVSRNFKQEPRKVLLTDITYLFYGKARQRAYLSTIKDSMTNEILAYKLSENLEVDFVLKTVKQLFKKYGKSLKNKKIYLHSDQGFHYTSISYTKLVESKGLIRSMSRRGNCWDNAPQESFFGHMKDELHLKNCDNYKALTSEINKYMNYYNNYRYQTNLANLSPHQYYNYLETGEYPITTA